MIEKDENMVNYILEDIEENKEITPEDIIKMAIEYKGKILEFEEPDPNDMLDIEEKEKIQSDTYLLKQYSEGVENSFSISGTYYELYDDAIKFNFKEKEIYVGFSEMIDFNSTGLKTRYGISNLVKIYEMTFCMKINTNKRMHIKTDENLLIANTYESCFSDYEKHLDEYDREYDEKYKEYFSNKLEVIKNKQDLNLEKYILSESEKEFLVDLWKTYKFPFSLCFKDSILSINTEFMYDKENKKSAITKTIEFMDFIFKFLERFMYI